MSISDKQFEKEFDVKNDELLDMIVKLIKGCWIDNFDILSIAAKTAKHVE